MAWTPQQEKAIYTRGNNIIVSAGAGSGKTAVLSERILDYCLKGNDIRRVLVLTFTDAAASEMKERIRKKLLENKLFVQAELIDSADITTFDAYSLGLVKKYYYRLNLDKDVKIIDQSLLSVKTNQILDEIFQEKYEEEDQGFINLLRNYATKDDNNIKDMVLNILNKINLLVNSSEVIDNYEAMYFNENKINEMIKEYVSLALNKVNELKILVNECLEKANIYDDKRFINPLSLFSEELSKIITYKDAAVLLKRTTLPINTKNTNEQIKELKSKISETQKEICKNFFDNYLFEEEMKNNIYAIKSDVLYLLKLVKQLDERLFSYKKSLNSFDYSDIAKMAISLVRDYKTVHDEIVLNLDEILIDEYQDTSDIQETFISYISNNNCYMVGDIKQSIYRFRNANPYIFKDKYDNYSKNKGGIKIDLTSNFRSREEVLNNINLIFSNLMTDSCGDADYKIDHQMIFGLEKYKEITQAINYNMNIINYTSLEEIPDAYCEAFICGYKIKELLAKKPLCFKKGDFAAANYSDFAILIDKGSNFEIFKKVLEYLDIPASIEADLNLKDSVIPRLYSNILILLSKLNTGDYDVVYKHCLASIYRSFLVGYNDEEIYLLLKEKSSDSLLEQLRKLAYKALNISYEELFDEICMLFNTYEKLPLIGDVENSIVVLEYIFKLFQTINTAGMDLASAGDFLNNVFESDTDLKYNLKNNSNNCVKIMTIHRSKGLEFPYCFFPMLASKFNMEDIRKTVGFSKKYGLYVPFSDEVNADTIIRSLVNNEITKADISEKVRLLYVALTRAREKFYLICNDEEYKASTLERKKFQSFNQMIRSLDALDVYQSSVDLSDYDVTMDLSKNKKGEVLGKEVINYNKNSYLGDLVIKKRISKELNELTTPSLQRAIDLGLEFHECLEVLDFNNIDIEGLKTSEFIKSTLKVLLKHDIFKDISNAKTYHEHEFYFENDDLSYHGIIDLLVEYDDHVDIIDYKLSNTDSIEYERQLKIYKEYVLSVKNKPVNCYLLSILQANIKKIEV